MAVPVRELIPAIGKQITLGSSSPYTKVDEEFPRLSTSFTYSYSMDTTETTQGEYETLMGRNPVLDNRFGKRADFPVYNVSFYDAALFCNARSKSENKDTVYSYTARQQDATGRTYDLAGLVIHYEREGYRLPTEAEWEFAARGGITSTFPWGEALDSASASNTGWFSGNSSGKTHPVGSFPANAFGLKDMLGNVMEWVNDWKGPYANVPLRDFLGNRDPGLVAERVVKGGAFSYDMRYMRYSGRSANYPTLSSAAVEYVGFRCVLGRIPGGQYLSGGGAFAGMPPVTVYPGALQGLLGHNKAKMVFVNATPSRRTLCYVNFTESPVTVYEFLDDSAVFAPVISPNGEWVAYGNSYEGDAGPGAIRVRRLKSGDSVKTLSLSTGACLPRWWLNPLGADTLLVYATSCRDNMEAEWGGDATWGVHMSGAAIVGSPFLVSAKGGYHDGLSDNGGWLASGYRRLRLRRLDLENDAVLFTGPQNGKPEGDTSQVCNVSLHPRFGDSPELLLLDFGFTGPSSVVGGSYRQHAVLFRVDSSGSVLRWYRAPAGFVAWQDAEWSNHRDFAVALGEDPGGNYPAIVGVNLRDSISAVLANGNTLRQPGLWVKQGSQWLLPGGLDPDSLGRYNEPVYAFAQQDLAMRFKILWQQRASAQVVCLGSSHVRSGIWPKAFQHYHALNLGYVAAGMWGNNELLTKYILPHFPKLRAVILEISPGWMASYDQGFTFTDQLGTGAGKTKGYRYDSTHDFWADSIPGALDSIVSGYEDAAIPVDSLGGMSFGHINWGPISPSVLIGPPVSASANWTLNDSAVVRYQTTIGNIVQTLQSRGIFLVMVVYPQSPNYRNTPYHGRYGPEWALGRAAIQRVKSICDGSATCHLYDAYQDGNHDYADSMAIDEDHLSNSGARQLSSRLDSLIFEAIGPGP